MMVYATGRAGEVHVGKAAMVRNRKISQPDDIHAD